jgi:putative membrane protein (TIGR04086 family)
MLATLNLGAVIRGVGAGGLAASLLALGLSVVLTLLGLEESTGIGLVIGVVAGLAAGGWIAGWRAPHTHRFHGMVTGLLLAFMVVIVARTRGSAASIWVIAWQVVLAVAVAGTAGWLAGRRKAARG